MKCINIIVMQRNTVLTAALSFRLTDNASFFAKYNRPNLHCKDLKKKINYKIQSKYLNFLPKTPPSFREVVFIMKIYNTFVEMKVLLHTATLHYGIKKQRFCVFSENHIACFPLKRSQNIVKRVRYDERFPISSFRRPV